MAVNKQKNKISKEIPKLPVEKNVLKWFLNKYVLISAIIIFASIIYFPSLKNDFINYDDSDFIIKNEYIRNLSWDGVKNIFLALDKHDPITVLSHAVTYKIWNLNPLPYHVINLLLHLINIFLVFILILKISKNKICAGFVALLFAVHPLRVESICWISERKDVLYTAFFLLSVIIYISYITNGYKLKFLIFSLLFFLISLLSKFSAVTLPFVLILLDYFYNRKINYKSLLEKFPYFVFSIFLVCFHFVHIEKTNNVANFNIYSFFDKIFFCSYSILYYIIQLFYFINYSVIYPYPSKINGFLPVEYYFSLAVVLIIITIIYFILKKNPKYLKEIVFGILFFLINISLVLHIVPVHGIVIVADRYSYIAYIGIFFIPAYLISNISKNNLKYLAIILLFIFIIFCSISTIYRTKVWKNGLSFWNNVTDKNPEYFLGYYGKGVAIYNKWDYKKSKIEFDKSIKANSGYGLSYLYRARCESKLYKFKEAIKDYNSAIEINPNDANLYFERGNLYFGIKNLYESINDFNVAIKLNQNNPSYYNNRGFVFIQLKQYEKALNDINKAIELNPLYSEALNNRANLKLLLKDYKGALCDLDYTISLKPEIIDLYISKAKTNLYINDFKSAISDCLKGLTIDRNNSTLFLLLGIADLQSNNIMDACKQLRKASSLGNFQADSLLRKYCKNNY